MNLYLDNHVRSLAHRWVVPFGRAAFYLSFVAGSFALYGAIAGNPLWTGIALIACWGFPWLGATFHLLVHYDLARIQYRAWVEDAKETPSLRPPPCTPLGGFLRAWGRTSVIWIMVFLMAWTVPTLVAENPTFAVFFVLFPFSAIYYGGYTFLRLSPMRSFSSPGREYEEGLVKYFQFSVTRIEDRSAVEHLLAEVNQSVADGESWKWS